MAKTIEQYKADYAAAKAAGNAAAMQAANAGANAIRASQGVAAEYATADIAKTAAKNTTPTPTKTNTSSVAGVRASNAAQQSILDAMAANSEAWHKASAVEKARLEAQNKNYANQLGALGLNLGFDSGSGMWSGVATTQAPTAGNVTNPGLNGLPLGDVYGLTYDYDKILGLLNKATTDAYAARETEAKQTENTFYRNMVDTQSATLDTLRQTQAAAVATGASRGIAAAQELSAILGMQEEAGVGATDLANARLNLSEKKQSEMSQNASSALDTSNAIKQAIANMDLTKYGYDVQKLMGDLDYLASLYNSDKTLDGVKYNADKNLQGTQYATDNQPKYTNSSDSSWNGSSDGNYDGSDGNGATGDAGNSNNKNTNAQGNAATGGNVSAKSLNEAIAAGGGAAQLSGTNLRIAPGAAEGLYTLIDSNGNGNNDYTEQDVRRIQNNNGNLDAAKYDYGVNALTNALQVSGKKLTTGGNTYEFNPKDGLWYSGAKGNTYTAAQVKAMDGKVPGSSVKMWQTTGARVMTNADGSVSVYPKGTSGSSAATGTLFKGVLSNNTTIVVDGVPFSYNANAGVWQGQSSNAKVNMDTFVKRVQQAKSITLK